MCRTTSVGVVGVGLAWVGGVIEANLKSVVDSVLRSPDVHERATNYGKYFQQMRWSHAQEKTLGQLPTDCTIMKATTLGKTSLGSSCYSRRRRGSQKSENPAEITRLRVLGTFGTSASKAVGPAVLYLRVRLTHFRVSVGLGPLGSWCFRAS